MIDPNLADRRILPLGIFASSGMPQSLAQTALRADSLSCPTRWLMHAPL
jgi:hypothetical protein